MAEVDDPENSSGQTVDSDLAHFRRCTICGQIYDLRRLGQVMYHRSPLQAGHEPMDPD